MKNILVVNDDGFQAEGIHKLVEAISGSARVFVCAPDGQRSGKSNSITVHEPIFVTQKEFKGAELAFEFSGTPTDCVKLGTVVLDDRGVHPDLLLSGINKGMNAGPDTNYSGTIGAAKEGVMRGIPTVALSVNTYFFGDERIHYESLQKVAKKIVQNMEDLFDKVKLYNINAPNLPEYDIKGILQTVQADETYRCMYQLTEVKGHRMKYVYDEELRPFEDKSIIMDSVAVNHGYLSVTPITTDLTDYRLAHNEILTSKIW